MAASARGVDEGLAVALAVPVLAFGPLGGDHLLVRYVAVLAGVLDSGSPGAPFVISRVGRHVAVIVLLERLRDIRSQVFHRNLALD